MRDIAERLGVSVSTVSLVLNGRDGGRVKPGVAARIRETARDLEYVPNQLARSLQAKQSHTLGIVSDRVASVPFSGLMLAGAQQAAWKEGYLLLVIDTTGDEELQAPAVESLLQRHVEAMIFATTYHRTVELPRLPPSVPLVILDGRPADEASTADYVVPDETGGARAAVEHLIGAGHTRIGFCTVPHEYPIAAALRQQGYRDALAAVGIPFDPDLVVAAPDASTAAAMAPARALLDRADRPSAVFCFGDQIAMAFYQVARELDLVIPRDLSVVGFDNQQFVADALFPGLTTVQLPHRAMGAWAVERALARIRGEITSEDSRGALMPCPLIQRASVEAPKN